MRSRSIRQVAQWPSVEGSDWWWWRPGKDQPWVRVEQFREGPSLVVRSELPGMTAAEDLDVTVGGGRIVIVVHDREYRIEIELPAGVTTRVAKATCSNGVLTIRMRCPKPESSSVKIPVTSLDQGVTTSEQDSAVSSELATSSG